MKWNNKREWAKFKRKQEMLRERYIAAGMTEDQIQIMYDFDLAEFNGKRREAVHTYRLDEADLDKEIVELETYSSSRYSWIDELENDDIIAALNNLPRDYIEILTDMVVDGLSQADIARKRHVGRSAIANKIDRIKDYFERF